MARAVLYITYMMYNSVTTLITSKSLYVEREQWSKLLRYCIGEQGLPCVFATDLDTVEPTL